MNKSFPIIAAALLLTLSSCAQDMAIPVSQLEAATGMVFFPRLRDVVGEEQYRRIKSENPRTRQEWR